jgi:hypothetical protein
MKLDGDDDEDNEIIGAETIFRGEAMAGGPGGIKDDPYILHFDAERAACLRELDPVVRRLLQQGKTTNAIISALAAATFLTLDRQNQH